MKTIATLLTALLLTAAPAGALPSTKLAAEWFAPFQSDTKKFALVDEASGTVRVAWVGDIGEILWSDAIPTGIENVTDVASVQILVFEDYFTESLALTSSEANRIGMVDISQFEPEFDPFQPFVTYPYTPNGIGPSGLSPIGTAPGHDLLVASIFNGSLTGKIEALGDLAGTGPTLAESAQNRQFRRLQPISAPGSDTSLALFTQTLGASSRMGLISRSGGNLTVSQRGTFPLDSEFATNIYSADHPTRTFAIAYRSGFPQTHLLNFTDLTNTVSDFTTTNPALPFPATTVMPVLGGGAEPITDGFIAIAADGSQARWMRINPAGDGYVSADPSHHFTPDPDTFLNGIIPVPGIGIVALQASTLGGPTTSYTTRAWDDSAWVPIAAGGLPQIPTPGGAPATILYYDEDPAGDEAARLIGIQSIGAWTIPTYEEPEPLKYDVFTYSFTSAVDGLTYLDYQPINPPWGTGYVMFNQVSSALSISTVGTFGAMLAPDLRIHPPSGTYDGTIQVTALFDDLRHDLLYRKDGGNWQVWQGAFLPVTSTTNLRFSLRSKSTNSPGPILSRQYILDAASLADLDSDNDGVPDYVEAYLQLNPFGGADSDGDGVSDLNEILKGTNPTDPDDYPANTYNISPGGSISIVASARNHDGTEIALAEEIEARTLNGSLLARSPVATVAPALPDGGVRGAILRSSATIPFGEIVTIRSTLYFNIIGGQRSGRETIRFIPADPPPAFAPDFTPTGTDPTADAEGWIAAAIAAAPGHPVANTRSIVAPVDSAASVLLEHLVHLALASSRPPADPAPPLDAFTLFTSRNGDGSRQSLTPTDLALLRAAGFDFRSALDLAETAITAMTPAANTLYQQHAATSGTNPAIPLPIDALRLLLRGEPLPSGYLGAVSAPDATAATDAYNAALANAAQAFRPLETWTLGILENPPARGIYQNLTNANQIVLLHPDGTRFFLDQGLGLQPGTRFTVTGFTDTPPSGSYLTMEITAAFFESSPAASDNDQDGNLLDDEWERFFFGSTGQNPYAEPHGGGFTLLQYFLDGTDPRGGEFPAGQPVALIPQLPIFATAIGGGFTLDFLFPAAYQDQVAFVLECSTTLAPGSWVRVPDVLIEDIGGDELRVTIPPAAAPPGSAFYRVRLALD